jgi:hypothetical protein
MKITELKEHEQIWYAAIDAEGRYYPRQSWIAKLMPANEEQKMDAVLINGHGGVATLLTAKGEDVLGIARTQEELEKQIPKIYNIFAKEGT